MSPFIFILQLFVRDGMFDYGEFTRILKHGAKDPDDKWPMSHPFLAGLAAKVTSKATPSVHNTIWTLSNAKKDHF
jgi:hypothetical protein